MSMLLTINISDIKSSIANAKEYILDSKISTLSGETSMIIKGHLLEMLTNYLYKEKVSVPIETISPYILINSVIRDMLKDFIIVLDDTFSNVVFNIDDINLILVDGLLSDNILMISIIMTKTEK